MYKQRLQKALNKVAKRPVAPDIHYAQRNPFERCFLLALEYMVRGSPSEGSVWPQG